jgi:hypothetical protein
VVTRVPRARSVPDVPEFLVELYVPRDDSTAAARGAARARLAGEALTLEGTPIRYLRSIYVPEDETCFYLYEATSVADVRAAARRAGLPTDHICEAVEDQ